MRGERRVSRWVGLCVALLVLSCLAGAVGAATINVPANYATIQAAINAASNGDEVVIAQGTYREAIDFVGKAITVRSTAPTNNAVVQQTVIDGMQADCVVYFHSNETYTSVLSGLTIKNGKRGIYCDPSGSYTNASPTISYCILTANTGPGVEAYDTGARPAIEHCTIHANAGRGVYFHRWATGTVTNCSITSNAGGVYLSDGGTVEDNTIANNSTSDNGGGIWCSSGSVRDNVIRGNGAYRGGGLYCCDGSSIHNNLIIANTASYRGGGIYCEGTNNFRNNTVCDNTAPVTYGGGNVYLYNGSPVLLNCIIAYGRAGKGIYVSYAHPVITYCALFNNTEGDYGGDTVTPGAGCLSVDPLFVSTSPNTPNYRLKSQGGRWTGTAWVSDTVTSPCVDAGDPSADYGYEPTPNGNRINMGFDGNTQYASKSGPAPPVRKPDMMICNQGQTTYLGDGIYNSTGDGQTRERLVPAAAQSVFLLKLQNDSTATDSFVVRGPAGGSGWTLQYLDGATGTTDVTSQVTATSGWAISGLARTQTRTFRLIVTAASTVTTGAWKSCLVTATSTSDTTKTDTVQARTQKTVALIKTATPANAATDAPRWGPVTIEFSQPVQQSSIESRFSLTGSDTSVVKGRFTWLTAGTKVSFAPRVPLKARMVYTAKLSPTMYAADGTSLTWTEQFSFTTGNRPVVATFSPQGLSVGLSANIVVAFNAPMNKTVTQTAFSVTPALAGVFTWSTDSKTLTFNPTANFAEDADYTVKIAGTAASSTGTTTKYDFAWTFSSQAVVPLNISGLATAPTPAGGIEIRVSLSTAATTQVDVLNMAGRPVAVLPSQDLPRGPSTLLWSGRSSTGTAVPAGAYLVRLTARSARGAQTTRLAPCVIRR